MKSFIDQEMVRRKARIAHTASLGGMGVLLAGVIVPLFKPELASAALIFLIVGFAISATGVYLANAWVKKPRPEDSLDKALKGLSDTYRLYHYLSPGEHLLLAPNGLVVFETVNLDGVFSYENGKWRQRMSMNRALRFVFDERLGDPVKRAQQTAERVQQALQKRLGDGEQVPTYPAVVFTHPAAVLEVQKAPIPVLGIKKAEKALPKNQAKMAGELHHRVREILDEAVSLKTHKIG